MGIRNSEKVVLSNFLTDQNGNPTGGHTWMDTGDGQALRVNWQNGIVENGEQNGAFVEDVLEAARQRILFFNSHPKFRCRENSLAITRIEEALQWLDWRTRQRLIENVENSYEAHSGS